MLPLMLFGSIEVGLIYATVALGVLISYRLLDFPDMTADGSFPLGGAVCGLFLYLGHSPAAAMLWGALAGAVAGAVTAYLCVSLHIAKTLSSVIVMLGLYSVNLRVLGLAPFLAGETPVAAGAPNLPLLGVGNVFTPFVAADFSNQFAVHCAFALAIALACWLALNLFLSTGLGLALLASGMNQRMASAHGINSNAMFFLGMALSNFSIALGGALFVQTQGCVDVSIGIGTVIAGLAAVIIGESLFPTRNTWLRSAAIMVGSVLYRIFVGFAIGDGPLRHIGMGPEDLNLITAVLVAAALVLPRNLRNWKRKLLSRKPS
ncbi:MAG: ABC transporter permease [Puniceicoccales bacterium]|jgi:putative ABC transport system permease protein|nr:ABC transporter permease [Puniceicoccales bacterium]